MGVMSSGKYILRRS